MEICARISMHAFYPAFVVTGNKLMLGTLQTKARLCSKKKGGGYVDVDSNEAEEGATTKQDLFNITGVELYIYFL